MTIEATTGANRSALMANVKESAAVVLMSPEALVAMCAEGMGEFDDRIGEKTAKQRSDVGALKRLGQLKTLLSKHQHGLDNTDDGDKKRAGEGNKDAQKKGQMMRGREFDTLYRTFKAAAEELPPEYREVAHQCLSTMNEKKMRQFDQNQAATMMQAIDSKIDDINTRQQAAMAEINSLMSKRSNIVEMTKNISGALLSQDDFITKNAAR